LNRTRKGLWRSLCTLYNCTRMSDKSYRRRLRSLLLCLCAVFRALVISLAILLLRHHLLFFFLFSFILLLLLFFECAKCFCFEESLLMRRNQLLKGIVHPLAVKTANVLDLVQQKEEEKRERKRKKGEKRRRKKECITL